MSVFSGLRATGAALFETEHAFAVRDAHPLSPGHMLACPVREVASMDDLHDDELIALWFCVETIKEELREASDHVTGFRVMINEGLVENGGPQHIAHLHVHVIPWYAGMKP